MLQWMSQSGWSFSLQSRDLWLSVYHFTSETQHVVRYRDPTHACSQVKVKSDDIRKSHDEKSTLSEEIAHPTVYHHLSELSVDIQLNGLIK